MKMKLQPKAGFSLIELMCAIVILGVLAGVGVPAYKKYVERSKSAEGYAMVASLQKGYLTWAYENQQNLIPIDVVYTSEDGFIPESGSKFAIYPTDGTQSVLQLFTNNSDAQNLPSNGNTTALSSDSGEGGGRLGSGTRVNPSGDQVDDGSTNVTTSFFSTLIPAGSMSYYAYKITSFSATSRIQDADMAQEDGIPQSLPRLESNPNLLRSGGGSDDAAGQELNQETGNTLGFAMEGGKSCEVTIPGVAENLQNEVLQQAGDSGDSSGGLRSGVSLAKTQSVFIGAATRTSSGCSVAFQNVRIENGTSWVGPCRYDLT